MLGRRNVLSAMNSISDVSSKARCKEVTSLLTRMGQPARLASASSNVPRSTVSLPAIVLRWEIHCLHSAKTRLFV